MKTIETATALLTLLLVYSTLIAQEGLIAKQIADKSFEATKLAGSEAVSTMTIVDSTGVLRGFGGDQRAGPET